jgi:hypothetical protein
MMGIGGILFGRGRSERSELSEMYPSFVEKYDDLELVYDDKNTWWVGHEYDKYKKFFATYFWEIEGFKEVPPGTGPCYIMSAFRTSFEKIFEKTFEKTFPVVRIKIDDGYTVVKSKTFMKTVEIEKVGGILIEEKVPLFGSY